MADFTTLRRTDTPGFAGGEGGHVVVQHEAVLVFAGQGVDDLLVAAGAQGGDHQGLGFAAGEQGGAVGAGQYAMADADGAHGAGIAAVDAGLAGEDAAADDGGFQFEEQVADGVLVWAAFLAGAQGGHHLGTQFLHALAAILLAGDVVGFFQLALAKVLEACDEGLVLGRSLPVPLGLAGFLDELVDGLDGLLHLGVAIDHGAEHDFLGQFLGFGLDHQHGALGAGDDQVKLGFLELGGGGAQHVLAVDVADAGGTDGAVEGHAGDGQGGGSADQGRDVGVDLGVQGEHGGDHLDFIVETVREERADGAVDQAGGQGLLLGRTALALEEAAGDTAGSVKLFLVIDGQGEEILAGLGILGCHDGDQHHRVVHGHHHGTAGLTGDLAGLQGDLMGAIGEGLFHDIEHGFSSHTLNTTLTINNLQFRTTNNGTTKAKSGRKTDRFFSVARSLTFRSSFMPRREDDLLKSPWDQTQAVR